jgi:AraC-like DNA-binding protein
MEYMAAKFHFSPNYLSTFFKNKVGESLQQYIIKFKLGLVANSLLNSNKTLFEISFEFGFTDESHLSKVFRKHYGQSPGLFRKNNAKVSVS